MGPKAQLDWVEKRMGCDKMEREPTNIIQEICP